MGKYGVRKVIASCPHCFNTIANEYPQLGGSYEVVHATQLVERLIADGRLTLGTVASAGGRAVAREERTLEARFGDAWRRYASRVPRWI